MSDDEDDADEARRQMMQHAPSSLVRQASSRFGRGNALASTKEVELHGVLEKRNRNGIYQKRYFQTERSLLKYWSSESDKHNAPSSIYDVRDVRVIHSVASDQTIHIQFSNDKFKLDLRAISEEQCEEWSDFLKAKATLYSMDNLLSSIEDGLTFKTRTFESLLKIPVADQDNWVNNILNDSFETILDLHKSNNSMSKLNMHRAVLSAARACLDEFTKTCKECALEMDGRDPKIMAHCRDFMHRFSVGFMSRITLELSTYLGRECLQEIITLGDMFLVECLRFVYNIDAIKYFQFLPRSMFQSLRDNLLSFADISEAFIELLLDRNEAIFEELNELQPRQRGKKLGEYYQIVAFQIDAINSSFYVDEASVVERNDKIEFIRSAVHTMVQSLAEYIELNEFVNYGEEGLIEHILACQNNIKRLSALRVYPHAKYDGDGVMIDDTESKRWYLVVSNEVLEEIGTKLSGSADRALEKAISNLKSSCFDMEQLFLMEKGDSGWLGGELCKAYLTRVSTWLNEFCLRGSATPCEFHRISTREVIRMIVITYMKKIIDTYFNDKKFKLSEDGVQQVASDLQHVISWVDDKHSSLIPPGVNKSDFTGLNDVSMLLRNTRMLLMSDEDNLLLCFSESIQHFGHKSIIHLYDLSRLILKVREDMSLKQRKHMLAVFSYYVEQFQTTSTEIFEPLGNPHPRLAGAAILAELFPLAGEIHCTGTKWHYEQLARNQARLKFEIMTLVTDAVSLCRERRREIGMENLSETDDKRKSFTRGRKIMGFTGDGGMAMDRNSKRVSTILDEDNTTEDISTNKTFEGHMSNDLKDDEGKDEDKDESEGWMLLRESHVHEPSNRSMSMRFSEVDVESDERPLIDLYGIDFEDLHKELCPIIYRNMIIPPVQFVSLQERYWLRPRITKEKDHHIEYLLEENTKLKESKEASDEAKKLQAELDAARAEMELLKKSLAVQEEETKRLKLEQSIAESVKLDLEKVAKSTREQIESESTHSSDLLKARLEAAQLAVKVSEETLQSLQCERDALSRKLHVNTEISDALRDKLSSANAELREYNSLKEKSSQRSTSTDEDEADDNRIRQEISSLIEQIALLTDQKKSVLDTLNSYQSEIDDLDNVIAEAKAQMAQKVTVANAIKKDQEVFSKETLLLAEREQKIRRRIATEELRLQAEKREQAQREAALEKERIRQDKLRREALLQEKEAAKVAEEKRIAEEKRRCIEEATRKRAERFAELNAKIVEEETALALALFNEFDLEVICDFTTAAAELAIKEVQDEQAANEVMKNAETARLTKEKQLKEELQWQKDLNHLKDDEARKQKEEAKSPVNYEVAVIRYLGPTAEFFFIEMHKECIYECWAALRDGLKVYKYEKSEGGSNERYLHVDLQWTKLYWRNKKDRDNMKKASKRTSVFGKTYGDREFLLSDVTNMKRHEKFPRTLVFQCDAKKRSYAFEISESHFVLMESAMHLVLDYMTHSKK